MPDLDLVAGPVIIEDEFITGPVIFEEVEAASSVDLNWTQLYGAGMWTGNADPTVPSVPLAVIRDHYVNVVSGDLFELQDI